MYHVMSPAGAWEMNQAGRDANWDTSLDRAAARSMAGRAPDAFRLVQLAVVSAVFRLARDALPTVRVEVRLMG